VTFTPTSANFATESTTVSITVLQKSVTVTADNESIIYGALPQSTFTVAGLAVGDSESATAFTYAGTGGTSYSSSTTAPTNAGTYSITPSALTLSTGRLANYAITYQAGTLNIAKAVQQPITATPSATAVTYAPAPNKTTVTLSSAGGSGEGSVTYTVAQNDPCSINGTTLTVDGAGSCSVTATKATSANFLSRASSPVVITVNKASQTLSLDSISAKTYGDSQFTVTTSATSGLTVSIAASPSTVCDVPSGQSIRIISTGTCTVTATQSGDSNWQSATVAAGSSSTRTFVISPKVLSILGATANNRTYDGTSDATAQISFGSASLSGVVSGDSVSINASNASATFATKNIGSSKPITISGLELSGTHAHRYVVDTPTDLSANVTALTITVGGITVPTRAYNGTNVASLSTSTYAFTGVLNNDSVTLNDSSYVATFANANVSPTAKLVTVSGLLLSGTDAANYTLTQPTLQGFVVKATASVLLGPDVSAVYTGSPLAIATATQPSSLSLVMSYSGSGQTSYGPSSSAPTNAGSYSALATVNDVNYQGNGSSPWTITKQTVSVQVSPSSLSQTFTGSVRPIAPSTSPSGMNISISYSGTNGNTYQSSWAPVNAGTYSVSVTVVEANFQGTVTETLTVAKASQSPISLTNTSSLRFGTTLQLVPVGGSGSGAYTYSVSSGPCQVNDHSGVVTPNGVGNCSVVAHRESSTNYHSASSSPHSLTISKGTQVAAFTSLIPSVPVTGSTYTPTATTTSGLAPTISVSTGAGSVCTLSNGTLTFNASGLCVLSASQPGDSNWLVATTATQSIEVGKLSQAITFPQPASVDLGSPDFTLDASTSSGLPLTYSVTAGNSVCSISSIGIVSIASVGACTIETLQAGDSTFAAASTVTRTITVLPSLPTAPHITSISSGDSTVTVGFKAPHSNGGSAIVSYALVATSNTAPTVSRTDCSTSTLSCTLVGLVNGTSYTVTVAAINVRGTGTPSDTEEVLIPLPTIAAARNIVGTRQSTTIDLPWEDPNTYGPGTFVHYEVYLKQRGGSFGAPVTVQSSDRIVRALTTQSRTVQFTQLDPSRLYESKIVTITSTASAETSENTATALVMPLSIPSAPRDLTVEAPSGTSARLSWRTPETDGGSALQSYSVTTSAGTCSLSSPLATSCSITGLQPGASLSVSLRAVNAAGQSIPANTALTIPNVPGAPSLGVISTGTTFANISWTSPASNGGRVITSYSVEAVEVNQPSQVLRCTSAGLSCVINNLKATTQYSFTVKATNSVGTGAASAAITLTTNRAASTEWDSYRTTTPVVLASQLSLPPAPARVTSQGVGGRRTQITAVRSARDAAIPVTYALISVSTRTNKLLARIKVIVDPQNPSTTVSVPYASSKVKIAVQFANDIGLSPGGPAGTNIAEGNTFEWTTVAGQVTLVGSQVPGGIYFARSSSQLTYTAQQTLKKMAATAKSRGGLVYVTGFAQRGESKSAWMLEPLARARAEAVAKYLSRIGVRQWITFHGTTARATTGWKPITGRRVIVTTVYPTESSPTVLS
jgi:outer membrane protein OmpA-like peptidoglycan-associated protein